MKKNLLLTLLISAVQLSFFTGVCFSQWVQVSGGMGNNQRVSSFTVSGGNIYSGTIYSPNGVWKSTNNGNNWVQTSLNNQSVQCLTASGSNILAGTISNGIFYTTDGGTSWTQSNLNNRTVRSFAVNQTYAFASAQTYGVYISTNHGVSWTQTGPGSQNIYACAVSGDTVYAGSGINNGVFVSTDNGSNWAQTSLTNTGVLVLTASGNKVFAGTLYGIYKSTNKGANWTLIGLDSKSVYSVLINGNNIIAGTDADGVYFSPDNGASWIQKNEGLNYTNYIYALHSANNFIFAGTWGNSAWRRPISEVITGISTVTYSQPKEYLLMQNYPNPFNPVTKIKFDIPKSGFTELKVFDITGREVQTLVNEQLSAGSYEVTFDGSGLAGGVYFYRLQTNGFTKTEKLILQK